MLILRRGGTQPGEADNPEEKALIKECRKTSERIIEAWGTVNAIRCEQRADACRKYALHVNPWNGKAACHEHGYEIQPLSEPKKHQLIKQLKARLRHALKAKTR